jgi:hypothetical protein
MVTMRIARCLLLLVQASAFGQNLTPEAWKEDLDFLARELPARHKNLYYRLKPADFSAQAAKIAADIPRMSEPEIRLAFLRLVASAGNAHTTISALSRTPIYPLQFYQFPDGYYVLKAAPEYRDAIGARLVSIDGTPAAEWRTRLLPLVARETPQIEKIWMPALLRTAYAVGPEGGVFRFDKNDRQFDLKLLPSAADRQPVMEDAQFAVPLYLTDRRSAYWFRYLEAENALYIQYNRCEEVKSHPFAEFTKEVMATADSKPVDKVIIDLRHNGGGNSEVLNPLVNALKARRRLTQKGHLFVLTSRETFSSAFIAEWRLQKLFHAQIAGEPSAQRPNSYGEVGTFKLPNSKLEVRYCTKFFRFAPGDPDELPLDLKVDLTARDYFAGRDPVLERVLGR